MTLDTISNIAGLVVNVITVLAIGAAGWAAYGVFLASSYPDVFVETIVFLPKQLVIDNDSDYPFVFSLQFRFLNPAVGSKVVTEVVIGEAKLTAMESKGVWVPIGLLPFAKLAVTNSSDFSIETLYRPIVLMGHGLEMQNVLFSPKNGTKVNELSGQIHVEIEITYKVHNPLTRVIRKPRPMFLMLDIEFQMEEALKDSKARMFQSNYFSQRAARVKK